MSSEDVTEEPKGIHVEKLLVVVVAVQPNVAVEKLLSSAVEDEIMFRKVVIDEVVDVAVMPELDVRRAVVLMVVALVGVVMAPIVMTPIVMTRVMVAPIVMAPVVMTPIMMARVMVAPVVVTKIVMTPVVMAPMAMSVAVVSLVVMLLAITTTEELLLLALSYMARNTSCCSLPDPPVSLAIDKDRAETQWPTVRCSVPVRVD